MDVSLSVVYQLHINECCELYGNTTMYYVWQYITKPLASVSLGTHVSIPNWLVVNGKMFL